MFPSRWLVAADLPDNGQVATIRRVQYEEVVAGDEKPVVYFQEFAKGLILNRTNCLTVASIYGDHTDDWEGQPITLFPTQVDFQGKQVDGIRVRNRKPTPAGEAANKPNARKKVVTQADVDQVDDDVPL
jgi:hypothetical protein